MATKVNTRDKIKLKSLVMFAKEGYHNTSVDDIARSVGIKKASVYSHIKSKDELFLEVLSDCIEWEESSFKELFELIKNGGTRARLKAIFEYYFHLYNDPEVNYKIFLIKRSLFNPPSHLTEKIAEGWNKRNKYLESALSDIHKEGLASGKLKATTESTFLDFFYCVMNGIYFDAGSTINGKNIMISDGIWMQFWDSIKP